MSPPVVDVRHPNDWPTYWFAKLERAVNEGDHQAAAYAQKELARLGVIVSYGRPGMTKAVLCDDR